MAKKNDSLERRQKAVYLIKYLLGAKNGMFEESHIRELLSTLIWKITEVKGKYNLDYVSLGALHEKDKKQLVHEHVYERAKLVTELLKGEKNVDQVLNCAIACLVTKKEHELLSRVEKNLTGWDRYILAGVDVYDSKTGRKVELIKIKKVA